MKNEHTIENRNKFFVCLKNLDFHFVFGVILLSTKWKYPNHSNQSTIYEYICKKNIFIEKLKSRYTSIYFLQ